MEAVFAWTRDVGQNLDALTPVQRKELLQMVVEEVIVDRNNKVETTLAIPIESEPTWKFFVSVTTLEPCSQSFNRQTKVLFGVNYSCRSCCLIGECYRNGSLWSQPQPEGSPLLQHPTAPPPGEWKYQGKEKKE